MLNYELYTVEVDSVADYGPKKGDIRVKFPDSKHDLKTFVDSDGHLYFSIPNILNNGGIGIDFLFTDRIQDAVQCIMLGYGDCIEVFQNFGPLSNRQLKVLHYVDRVFGEAQREKSLLGWKDTVFTWCIRAGFCDSLTMPSIICSDYTTYTPFLDKLEQSPILFFETESLCLDFISDILSLCKCEAQKYVLLCEDEKDLFLNSFIDKYSLYSFIFDLFHGCVKEIVTGKSNYYLKPCQCIKE